MQAVPPGCDYIMISAATLAVIDEDATATTRARLGLVRIEVPWVIGHTGASIRLRSLQCSVMNAASLVRPLEFGREESGSRLQYLVRST